MRGRVGIQNGVEWLYRVVRGGATEWGRAGAASPHVAHAACIILTGACSPARGRDGWPGRGVSIMDNRTDLNFDCN